MEFVAAKCPSCGGELQVDSNVKTGFCMHCGSQIIIEQAIENKKITVEGIASYDQLLRNAQTFYDLGDKDKAKEIYRKLSQDYPHDHEIWWGYFQVLTDKMTVMHDSFSLYEWDFQPARYAIQLADTEQKAIYEQQARQYLERISRNFSTMAVKEEQRLQTAEREIEEKKRQELYQYQDKVKKEKDLLAEKRVMRILEKVAILAIAFIPLAINLFSPNGWLFVTIPFAFVGIMPFIYPSDRDSDKNKNISDLKQNVARKKVSSHTEEIVRRARKNIEEERRTARQRLEYYKKEERKTMNLI